MVSPKDIIGIILRLSGKNYHFSPGVTPQGKEKMHGKEAFDYSGSHQLGLAGPRAPGLAVNYTLPGVNEALQIPGYQTGYYTSTDTCTEIHGVNEYFNSKPGNANGKFFGSYYSEDGHTWGIGDISYPNPPQPTVIPLVNSVAATSTYNQDRSRSTVTIVYDTVKTPGTVKFSENIPGAPVISSSDFLLMATAEYSTEKEGGVH